MTSERDGVSVAVECTVDNDSTDVTSAGKLLQIRGPILARQPGKSGWRQLRSQFNGRHQTENVCMVGRQEERWVGE